MKEGRKENKGMKELITEGRKEMKESKKEWMKVIKKQMNKGMDEGN